MTSNHFAKVACFLLTLAGCGSGAGVAVDGALARERAEVLAHVGEQVILPALRSFVTDAQALSGALSSYADDPTISGRRTAAQAAWVEAMETWQEVEVMQLGPLGEMGVVAGGEDRRDQIYAWPAILPCSIDQLVAGSETADRSAVGATTVDTRGLLAIEFLLFNERTENNCAPGNPINSSGTWDGFSASDLEGRRARLAHTMARIVEDEAVAVRDRFEPSGGNFLQELSAPTRAGALYGTAQEGLNAVFDAMFYIDTETKDMKLAGPAGIAVSRQGGAANSCDAASCADARESLYANRSADHVVSNLQAFRRLYLGADPGTSAPGFDDLLVTMGARSFADQLAADIDTAIIKAEAIQPTLVDSLGSDTKVAEAHTALVSVTDSLKTMFVSVLDLEVPQRAAGDND